MNTKPFRRELLVGIGGFAFGALVVAAVWPNQYPRPQTLNEMHQAAIIRFQAAVIKDLVAPKLAAASSSTDFGLYGPQMQQDGLFHFRPASAPRTRELFDMPRQNPWVAPSEFLIHPDERH